MEAEHDNLQPVAPVGAFEEAWLDEVLGAAGGEVDAPVRQAVAVQEKNITEIKEKTLPSSTVFAFCSSSSLGMLSRQAGSVFAASSGFALELCKHFLPPSLRCSPHHPREHSRRFLQQGNFLSP